MFRRRSVNKRKSSSGQAPVIAGMLFLLLVPTTIIIAENATLNLTGDLLANTSNDSLQAISLENATLNDTSENQALADNLTNQAPGEENPTDPSVEDNQSGTQDNTTVNETDNIELINQSLPDNETNITIPVINESVNITLPENESQKIPENQSQEPIPEQPLLGPDLVVSLEIPGKADRGESFGISCRVENNGDLPAEDVIIRWELPSSILVLDGNIEKSCGRLNATSMCDSVLVVGASRVSRLGEHEIKAKVTYHE